MVPGSQAVNRFAARLGVVESGSHVELGATIEKPAAITEATFRASLEPVPRATIDEPHKAFDPVFAMIARAVWTLVVKLKYCD